MKNKQWEIINDDSIDYINKLIANKIIVDHIITDPPYNISKKNNLNTLKNRNGVYFGEWDKEFDLLSWIPKYIKILKSNGSFIIFCSYTNISDICKILNFNGMNVKDIIVWKKTNPMPRNVNRRYVQDLEFAIWAVKGKKWIFNNINKPYTRSIFEFPIVSGKERTTHPTQKSLKLMEVLIKIHTKKNDLILDPFMGSGTTGLACIKNDRKFIGIEKENKFYNIAKKRLSKYEKN